MTGLAALSVEPENHTRQGLQLDYLWPCEEEEGGRRSSRFLSLPPATEGAKLERSRGSALELLLPPQSSWQKCRWGRSYCCPPPNSQHWRVVWESPVLLPTKLATLQGDTGVIAAHPNDLVRDECLQDKGWGQKERGDECQEGARKTLHPHRFLLDLCLYICIDR